MEQSGAKRSTAERCRASERADERCGANERANEWPIFHRIVSDRSIPPCDPSNEATMDLQWPPQEDGWTLASVQSNNQEADVFSVQSLSPLKTRAKDDLGKT